MRSIGFLALSLVSCSAAGGPPPQWQERLANIAVNEAESTRHIVVVPKRVRAMQPFPVEVTTYFGDCDRAGRNEVRTTSGVVRIRLYREDDAARQGPCTMGLGSTVNTIEVPGLRPGVWEVRVEGIRLGAVDDHPLTVRRHLIAE